MEITPELQSRLAQLEAKYAATGQNLDSYLEGLLYTDYLSYWDYIQLDVLLALQKPKTSIPDEQIFIIYHQITELYFKLVMLELEQLQTNQALNQDELLMRLERINRYFENLVRSFAVMVDGMDKKQFLQYRMALLPASGFQSAQYRMIEIACCPLLNLVDAQLRANMAAEQSIEKLFEHIYWLQGATELSTGKKTYTLLQFEAKYKAQLLAHAKRMQHLNVWQLVTQTEGALQNQNILAALKELDQHVNVNWPLAHYKSAVRYLHKNPADIAATGGTNWQKYLPPRFQKRIFFPSVWSQTELNEWGKSWVESIFKNI